MYRGVQQIRAAACQLKPGSFNSFPGTEQSRQCCYVVLESFLVGQSFFSAFSFILLKKKISGLLLQGLKEKKTNIVSITKPFLLPVFTFYNAGLFQINEFEGVPLGYAAGLHSTHSSPKGQSSKFTETRSQWLLGSVYIVGEE